jgi:hypothetical protein
MSRPNKTTIKLRSTKNRKKISILLIIKKYMIFVLFTDTIYKRKEQLNRKQS